MSCHRQRCPICRAEPRPPESSGGGSQAALVSELELDVDLLIAHVKGDHK